MVERDYFSHDVLDSGYQVYHWFDLNGLRYVLGGENIAWNSGYSDEESPVSAHEGFMSSPGHRANVLNPSWTHGGVGAWAADSISYLGKIRSPRLYTELFMQADNRSNVTEPTNPSPPSPTSPTKNSPVTSPKPKNTTATKPTSLAPVLLPDPPFVPHPRRHPLVGLGGFQEY